MTEPLQSAIEAAWEARETVTPSSREVRECVNDALTLLDSGQARVAEPDGEGGWRVHQWLKKAVLLSFRLHDNVPMENAAGGAPAYDKVPNKFAGWGENRFRDAGFRVVPGAVARRGSYIARGVVLMPSFVNIGAYVDEGTMVDTWATVGSCAQIGRNVHISGGAGIGGVLEPLQAGPVVIEDGAFIGARSEVAEGVRVGQGAVLSMGVYLGASTKIVDRATGEVHRGVVPPYSVVVPGALPGKPLPDGSPGPSLYCAVIVKTVDAQTRAKTGINELLRDGFTALGGGTESGRNRRKRRTSRVAGFFAGADKHTEGEEAHAQVDEARAGSTPNIVRWVLVISLLAAILLLSAIWIFGAATTDKEDRVANATDRLENADDGASTDSIVSGDEQFQFEEPAAEGEEPPQPTAAPE